MSRKLSRQFIKVREIEVEHRQHMTTAAWITGICCMPNGDVIMADNNNNIIHVFAISYEYLSYIALSNSPWDVDSIDKSHFVASIAGRSSSPQIHIFKKPIMAQPEIHYTITLSFICHGIKYANNSLVVTCAEEGSIKLLDMKGRVMWSVTGNPCMSKGFFERPLYIGARLDGLVFMVTDEKTHSISVLSYKGKILNTKTLKNERPLAITVNDGGEIFVCLNGSNGVLETTDTLINGKTHATWGTRICSPQAICYNHQTDQFLISSALSNIVNVYELM